MKLRTAPFLVILLTGAALAGCIGDDKAGTQTETKEGSSLVPVAERHLQDYTFGDWSETLTKGPYEILPALSVFYDVPVPTGQGLPQQGHMGVFLPKIDGCDWEAAELPEECQVPVVADIGPYYGEPVLGDVHATEPANRLGRFLIENLVTHGYAVAQVSVQGTGDAGGCMDLMGEIEQAGVQASVEWLGTQPWSNGAVGLTGRSYDGSTPWEAAMNGSPYLKTVVPISGLYGQHDLMWRNGTAETRGPGVLWGLYYAFTYTGNEGDPPLQAQQIAENLVCPETQTGGAQGVLTYPTGSKGPEANSYWHERSFKDEVLENYEGSVYFIHGMQDWNVDPHMAFPFYQELKDKGLEMKGLFGQWGHMYPDRAGEHDGLRSGYGAEAYPESVRYDWAQDLLEWFDHYLKGTGPKPELHVEIQDNQGEWRFEETYPPQDATRVMLDLGMASGPTSNVVSEAQDPLVFTFDALDAVNDTRIAGNVLFHPTVTPTGPGGQLFAELRDAKTDLRLGHAVMDLRYHAGGEEMQTVVPGMPIVAKMEFFAMDVVLPAGNGLKLIVKQTGEDYLPAAVSNPVLLDLGETSVLKLPIVERGEEAFFTPPQP